MRVFYFLFLFYLSLWRKKRRVKNTGGMMMSENVLDIFRERGFLQQITFEEELRELLATEEVAVYLGIDPTADSLHVGHLMGVMALAHLQKAGHRPLAVVGGGTAMIGDPSGRTELREMLTKEKIEENVQGIKKQLAGYLDFSAGRA